MNQSALEGFVKIVELNSYSAAAEALYLSQSALSQQIRTLEGQLGFELFQHVPRKVLLTPAGQDFYPRAKQMMELYREAVRHGRAVKQQANPPARHLELGVCHAAVRMFGYDLFALTGDLCLAYAPVLKICATRSELWRSLKKGESDLAFFSWTAPKFTRRGCSSSRCSTCRRCASPSMRQPGCRRGG